MTAPSGWAPIEGRVVRTRSVPAVLEEEGAAACVLPHRKEKRGR